MWQYPEKTVKQRPLRNTNRKSEDTNNAKTNARFLGDSFFITYQFM